MKSCGKGGLKPLMWGVVGLSLALLTSPGCVLASSITRGPQTLKVTEVHPSSPSSSPSSTSSSPSTDSSPGRARQSTGADKEELTQKEAAPFQQSQGQTDDSEDRFVDDVLYKYGYFREGKQFLLLRSELGDVEVKDHERVERDVTSSRTEAIRRFQSFFGLPVTGVADVATVSLMRKGRCGVPDIPVEEGEESTMDTPGRDARPHPRPHQLADNPQTPSDYSLLGSKWEKDTLTWRLSTPSRALSTVDQQETMEDAFAVWAEVAPLTFKPKPQPRGSVDIDIKFVRGNHGDEYPFDGKGKVLAHAFGPGEVELSGDMHMDNDERWGLESDSEGSSLFLVAAHELGHSLGLAHSRDPDALMYPYYGMTDRLGADDVKAIQFLYGKRIGKPPVKPKRRWRKKSTPSPTPTPSPTLFPASVTPIHQWDKSFVYAPGCDVTFDVVFQDDSGEPDVYTGIQGNEVFRFNRRGVISGYPASLSDVYPGAPYDADAAFGLQDKDAAYFIKGDQVWRFTSGRLSASYPKRLNRAHFRETIRFILPVTDPTGIRRIFVFGKTLWYEYNFDALPSHVPSAHVIPRYWPDISSDVKYAVTGYDGNTYFISPKSHVVLNSFRRALHGGKQRGHPYWLQSACYTTSGSRAVHSFAFNVAAASFLATFALLV